MKINLECGNDIRNGYLNINSIEVNGATTCRFDSFNELVTEDLEEIVSNYTVHKCDPDKVFPTIQYWTNLLKPEGLLHISFIDIRRVGFLSYMPSCRIELLQTHQFIYGPNNDYKSIMDLNTMKTILNACNLKINIIDWDQAVTCYVECQK